MINGILEIARKTPLRTAYRWARRISRNPSFRRTMKEILNNPQNALDNREVLAKLSYGWGNPSHSASVEYLEECVKYVAQSRLPILECGSGLTTIVAGIIAKKTGNIVWTIENIESWYDRIKKYLDKYKINSVNLIYSPLVEYGDFTWYNPPLDAMPDKFSLVICDGPVVKGGKYGLFPVMKERFASDCVILYDDAYTDQAYAKIPGWASELNMSYELRGKINPYYVIKLK